MFVNITPRRAAALTWKPTAPLHQWLVLCRRSRENRRRADRIFASKGDLTGTGRVTQSRYPRRLAVKE
ncbi:hypothetical protein CHARACLAT_018016 [Characodon lateralis]|uniref:Uncharacterized protein n=1 Tax=Characodon lateralis TaxID=208331 RepID=A0ABU7DLG5_9TELE|nr:hypothetical protein [Characodon lateralis]